MPVNELHLIYLGDRVNAAEALKSIPGYKLAAWIFEADNEEKAGIRAFCAEEGVSAHEVNSKKALFEALKNIDRIDLGVIVNFGLILSEEMIAFSKKGFVNVHLGSLPEYPGRFPVKDALRNNEKVLALTLHRVTEEVDGGEIIAKKWMPRGIESNAAKVLERMDRMIPDILKENLPL